MKNAINDMMLEQGLSVAKMSFLTERTPSAIYRIMDETSNPDFESLIKLCASLDCRVEDLFPGFYDRVAQVKAVCDAKKATFEA